MVLPSRQSGIDFAREIVSEVNRKVKRVYWANEEIAHWFGKRSANKILENGTTCFMNPCLDLNLVSSLMMSLRTVPNKLIVEEYPPNQDFDFNRLHFILEFEYHGKVYVLNYKRCNDVQICGGHHNSGEDQPVIQVINIPGEQISPEKTLYENLGYKTLEELLKDKFVGYSLERNLNRLMRDNSRERYNLFKRQYGDNFVITTL
jgi:hypothetical protein